MKLEIKPEDSARTALDKTTIKNHCDLYDLKCEFAALKRKVNYIDAELEAVQKEQQWIKSKKK